MFNKTNIGKSLRVALLSVLAAPLVACAGSGGLIQDAPALHIAISDPESDAQLIRQLQSQGYDDIRVTEFYPNDIDRRPELMHGFRSAEDEDAQVTSVHVGWNGTAEKDGRIFDIYVTRASQR
jgi:hypothetical protein